MSDFEYRSNWYIWLNNVYQDRSAQASGNIKKAFDTLEARLQDNKTAVALEKELGLCYPPTADNLTDSTLLKSWLTSLYSNVAEFNYAANRPGRGAGSNTLDRAIKIALEQKDPIQILNETLWIWWGPSPGYNAKCIDFRNSKAAEIAVPAIEAPIWNYVPCKPMRFDRL